MTISKEQFNKIKLYKNSSIRDVIKRMNKTGLKIVIIINEKGKLLGTIVDGDIRRSIIKGLNLDSNIKEVLNKKPIVTKKKLNIEEADNIMKSNKIDHLPIVNHSFKPVGLFVLRDDINFVKQNNLFIIMAGGKGTRLLPKTLKTPKALIKINGKPMLEHILTNAKKNGFFNFLISVNYLKKKIKNYFKDGDLFQSKISYIEENKPLGTAGSLSLLKIKKKQDIIVTNCDIISNLNYKDLLNFHQKNKSDATMAVWRFEKKNQYGVIKAKGKKLLGIEEKPIIFQNINLGIYVLKSSVFKYLKKNSKIEMTDFFLSLKKKKN